MNVRVALPTSAPCCVCVFLVLCTTVANDELHADVRLPSLFSEHMVLQRDQQNRVWGWASPGERVSVRIAGQSQQTTTGKDGRWSVQLQPMSAGGPHRLTVKGQNTLKLDDVLVGEVWVCSGQSNMQWSVAQARDADLETRTADYPEMRLITVPRIGTQEPQDNFEGRWEICSPQTVGEFSAVGYFFGRQLHQTLGVPVGLIDNAWGGSACEAWVRRDLLEADQQFQPLLQQWDEMAKSYDHDQAQANYQRKMQRWRQATQEARPAGKPIPARPRAPQNPLVGQHRPANLYNGVLRPIIGYGVRGAIWYQGESNASRAYQYRRLFPLMIEQWRDEWGQDKFSFYWVQLADYKDEQSQPGESEWAELREAQTMTMDRLADTGEAVIIDLGEGRDIHPRNKQDVAKRLARWALARDYGLDIAYRSPKFKSLKNDGPKLVLTFEHVGSGLYAFDRPNQAVGFTIAGEDRKFVRAQAKILGNDRTEKCHQVEVWSDEVAQPVAVRYAWADNPVCNLQTRDGLPVTPFRSDEWPGMTVNKQTR